MGNKKSTAKGDDDDLSEPIALPPRTDTIFKNETLLVWLVGPYGNQSISASFTISSTKLTIKQRHMKDFFG